MTGEGRHILIIFFIVSVTFGERNERLLLHSDYDVIAEITRLRAELNTIKQKMSSMETAQQGLQSQVSGSVYIRWGKKTCPNNTEIVYHGYTAGKKYSDKGSGSDNLCLPSDPTWAQYVDGYQVWRGAIYGTETDFSDLISSHNNQDMPCAVCKSQRSTTLMIPARKDCYPGWSLEYTGYLVSASAETIYFSYDHACLDGNPDHLDHGVGNDDEHIFHLVEGHCGSLPCPPYIDGRELACVVCSK